MLLTYFSSYSHNSPEIQSFTEYLHFMFSIVSKFRMFGASICEEHAKPEKLPGQNEMEMIATTSLR